jgi:hypothetical protein
MESVAIPIAVVLAAMMIIGSWGYPRSVRTVDRYAPCCTPVKMAAYSASATQATTHEMMDDIAWIVPLIRVG